jgi:hypothetical protein
MIAYDIKQEGDQLIVSNNFGPRKNVFIRQCRVSHVEDYDGNYDLVRCSYAEKDYYLEKNNANYKEIREELRLDASYFVIETFHSLLFGSHDVILGIAPEDKTRLISFNLRVADFIPYGNVFMIKEGRRYLNYSKCIIIPRYGNIIVSNDQKNSMKIGEVYWLETRKIDGNTYGVYSLRHSKI